MPAILADAAIAAGMAPSSVTYFERSDLAAAEVASYKAGRSRIGQGIPRDSHGRRRRPHRGGVRRCCTTFFRRSSPISGR